MDHGIISAVSTREELSLVTTVAGVASFTAGFPEKLNTKADSAKRWKSLMVVLSTVMEVNIFCFYSLWNVIKNKNSISVFPV